jgi:hypothetical protein
MRPRGEEFANAVSGSELGNNPSAALRSLSYGGSRHLDQQPEGGGAGEAAPSNSGLEEYEGLAAAGHHLCQQQQLQHYSAVGGPSSSGSYLMASSLQVTTPS